MRGLDSDVW
jgi:hypothetical protein